MSHKFRLNEVLRVRPSGLEGFHIPEKLQRYLGKEVQVSRLVENPFGSKEPCYEVQCLDDGKYFYCLEQCLERKLPPLGRWETIRDLGYCPPNLRSKETA